MATRKKVDIDYHVLMPKHEKLTDKDRQTLFERYQLSKRGELPRISSKDSAIATLNVKKGDIIKITRPSPTAGEAIFYREVLDV